MMSKPQLIIFDMDGLMLDTESLAIQGWKAAATTLGISIPDELYPRLIGLNRQLCKTVMLEHIGQDFPFDTAHDLMNKNIDTHIQTHGITTKPGLSHLLDKLDHWGIKKCVATSTATHRAIQKLTKANIAHRFETIIGGEQVTHSKPAPDIFLKAASQCNALPKDCIVLEDSNPGAQGGHSAGMRVIVVPDLVQPNDATRKNAYAICKDLHEVSALLSGIVS